MLNHQLEAKVLDIIERVANGQRVEDDAIELKSEWPADYRKTARQIAGHANSAAGQPILWVVGIDETKSKIIGVKPDEYSQWWNQVRSIFSEMEPEVKFRNVPAYGVTVVGILFQTDQAPYVVKTDGKGQASLEVPYRLGTGTETATRQQLVRILSAVASRIEIQVLSCEFIYKQMPKASNHTGFSYKYDANLFFRQQQGEQFYAVAQNVNVTVTNGYITVPLSSVHAGKDNETIDLKGPDRVKISGFGQLPEGYFSNSISQPIKLCFEFNNTTAGNFIREIPLTFDGIHQPFNDGQTYEATYIYAE